MYFSSWRFLVVENKLSALVEQKASEIGKAAGHLVHVKAEVHAAEERVDALRKEKAAMSSVLTKREREALGSGLLGLIVKTGGPSGDLE